MEPITTTAAAVMAGGNVLSSVLGGGGGGPVPGGMISDRSPINIAPTGVNFGEIIKPYSQGSPANGGMGLNPPSRYTGKSDMQYNTSLASMKTSTKNGLSKPLIVLLVGGTAITFFMIKFKG